MEQGAGRREQEDGRWKMEDGRWKMEDGRWMMEDGRWKMDGMMMRDEVFGIATIPQSTKVYEHDEVGGCCRHFEYCIL